MAQLAKILYGTALLLTLGLTACGEEFTTNLTVAADGSGDYRSIQSALDSIPDDNLDRIVIAIGPGAYNERIRISQNRLTLRGTSRSDTRIWFHFPRSEYDRRYDKIGPGVVNVFGEDVVLERLTVENTQPADVHAFAIYGQPNRLILSECDVLSHGGDTLSLWNTSCGMYYLRKCRFRGGVDFVCPRGWCFVRDSRFEAVGTSASIWHDGHMNLDMKFVLRNCHFDGPEEFWIGRNHYPSQFYLLDCVFSRRMADKPIGVVQPPPAGANARLWERKYFYNCHREGGDYAWHADNLDRAVLGEQAQTPPRPEDVTPSWTFGSRWDPESQRSGRDRRS